MVPSALIAVIGGEEIHRLGYLYVVLPSLAGPLLILAIALLVNNIPANRRCPLYWW